MHGLRLAAVAIVAQALLVVARTLCTDRLAAVVVAVGATALAALVPGRAGQVGAIAVGALVGLALGRAPMPGPRETALAAPLSRRAGWSALGLFALLLALSLLSGRLPGLASWDAFFRAGALVFGGGHVVLPLLQDAVVRPGWVAERGFLAGYGAAQAVPGPVFTFAAYLGALARVPPGGVAGGLVALVAIFLPGLLLMLAALPFWGALRGRGSVRAAMAGANAAVVGVLAAAFADPIWAGTVAGPRDVAIVALAFALLAVWRVPPPLAVLFCAACGLLPLL